MGVTVQTAGTRPIFAMLLMLAYAVRHCGVLALAGAGGPLLAATSFWGGSVSSSSARWER